MYRVEKEQAYKYIGIINKNIVIDLPILQIGK
jgi:hypothetical protein